MGEYLRGCAVKEFVLHAQARRLIERCGNRYSLSVPLDLVCWTPEWTAGVERVENHVAALLVIETFYKFGGRIVYDRGLGTVPDLPKYLHDELAFTGPGVTDYLDMLGLLAHRNSHQ